MHATLQLYIGKSGTESKYVTLKTFHFIKERTLSRLVRVIIAIDSNHRLNFHRIRVIQAYDRIGDVT